MTKGRIKMEEEVRSTLNDYTTRIKNRIEDNFRAFDQHLSNEEENLGKMKTLKEDASVLLDQVNRTLLDLLK